MVQGSPDIDDGARAASSTFAGQDVLVAHNAPFDLRFLNYERRRLAGRYFTQPWLDTLVLARRLLNGRAGRHDLATLAAWADTSVAPDPPRPARRRGHGRGAACGSSALLAERGIDTLERAVAFAGIGGARHAYKLALAEDLPPTPGVYLMRDRDGRRALRRQGGQPAPARALLLRPRRAPRAAHRAGARGARVDRPRDLRVGVRRAAAGEPAHQGAAAALQQAGRRAGRAST